MGNGTMGADEIEDIETESAETDCDADQDVEETETEGGEEVEEDAIEDDGEDVEDDDDEADSDLGERAQKRIGKLVRDRNAATAEVKALKRQLEEARRLGGDDGRAILKAAEMTGILPGLMTKDEAEAFKALDQYPSVIETYRDWLDDNDSDAEFDIGGGETMSYGAVKKRVRQLTRELEDIEERYGERRKAVRGKVRRIFELGLEAYRQGGGKSKGVSEKKPERKKLHDKPIGKKPVAKAGKRMNFGDVGSTDDLIRMLAGK